MSRSTYPYQPDYLVTPGDVIQDYLVSLSMTQTDLAKRLGMTVKTINEIINGKSPITYETSIKLERVLGRPSHFWNNLESQYQDKLIRMRETQSLDVSYTWLARVPVAEMASLGWIRRYTDKQRQLNEVLHFYGVSSPVEWQAVWYSTLNAIKQPNDAAMSDEKISAWLRQGEILAQQSHTDVYDHKTFIDILGELRSHTSDTFMQLIPIIQARCETAGVKVVFVPTLKGMGICGATRWIGSRPVIQLSHQFTSNDQFWFTFLHEAAHIIKHGRKEVFIEQSELRNLSNSDKEEAEADIFAQDLLISPSKYRRFVSGWDQHSLDAVVQFAHEIDIASGIVIGRLQRDGYLSHKLGNNLKLHYSDHHIAQDNRTQPYDIKLMKDIQY